LAAVLSALSACNAPPPTFGALPDFELVAVSAKTAQRPLKRADLLGRAWVADFIFTHCSGPCPALSARMSGLQKTLPAGVGLLSLTVDPDRDDAQALSDYAAKFAADPKRWLFVTGPKKRLLALLIEGFKLPSVEDASAPSGRRVTHSTRFVLIDGKARIRGYYDGEDEAETSALVKAAKSL
jgi:cytochrome oxidase Cu insertion factor (SCO1/SenC/PrrC family)